MKFTAIIIMLCFSLNALATPIKELEANFDSYNYAITVEWDQKDQNFYDHKTDEFIEQISFQILNNGLTSEEILALVERKVSNQALIDAMRLRFSLIPNLETKELSQVLKDYSKEFYLRGANWNNVDWPIVGAYAGGAVVLGALIWFMVSYDCVEYDFRRSSDCDSTNCYKKVCVEYVKKSN